MADIELVIKLSEDSYKATCNGYMLPLDVENVVQGIKNGTPLPKGHGRLIDADEVEKLDEKMCATECGCCSYDKCFYEYAPTIIEADKEQAAGVESHSEKEIYNGCLRLLRRMTDYFEEYLLMMDIHQEDLAEEERFSVALSNFDIVQNLFLFNTTHSGGTSTRKKCKELGLDDSDLVEFRFKSDPEYDDEEDV